MYKSEQNFMKISDLAAVDTIFNVSSMTRSGSKSNPTASYHKGKANAAGVVE